MTRTAPLLFLFSLAIGQAEGLSSSDRDRGLSELHGTRKQTLDAVDGLTAAQWSFKQSPDRWSIAEVMEHLAITERALLGMTRKLASGAPSTEPTTVKDADVLKMLASRNQAVKAPEMLVPTGRFGSGAENLNQYRAARDETLNYLRGTNESLREFRTTMPVGKIDAYQLLLYISGHNTRHLAQIAEIKADPKFPR